MKVAEKRGTARYNIGNRFYILAYIDRMDCILYYLQSQYHLTRGIHMDNK